MKLKTLLPIILLASASVSASPRIINANTLQLRAQNNVYVTLTTFITGEHNDSAQIELSGFDQYCSGSDTAILNVDGKAFLFNQGVVGWKCNYQPATPEAAKYLMNQLITKNVVTVGSYKFTAKGYLSSMRKMVKMLKSVDNGEK